MKTCEHCGGLQATEHLEMIAGTPCKCLFSATPCSDAPERKPAEVYPVAHFVKEEMEARGWSLEDLLNRLPGERDVNQLTLEIMTATPDFDHDIRKDMRLGEEMARILAHAFGTSKEFWMNLDAAWVKHQNE